METTITRTADGGVNIAARGEPLVLEPNGSITLPTIVIEAAHELWLLTEEERHDAACSLNGNGEVADDE